MGRMTYVKALMCLLFPSAALVARAQHPVAGDLKCKLTGRMLMDGGVYLGTFIKYYKISQLIHTQSIAN